MRVKFRALTQPVGNDNIGDSDGDDEDQERTFRQDFCAAPYINNTCILWLGLYSFVEQG